MKTKDAVAHLVKRLKKNPEFRESWKANIAMAFYDEMNREGMVQHVSDTFFLLNKMRKYDKKPPAPKSIVIQIANTAAENFLKQLCDEVKVPEGR